MYILQVKTTQGLWKTTISETSFTWNVANLIKTI